MMPSVRFPPPRTLDRRLDREPARSKVPEHVLFSEPDGPPTTPTGKVRKFRLAEHARRILEGTTT